MIVNLEARESILSGRRADATPPAPQRLNGRHRCVVRARKLAAEIALRFSWQEREDAEMALREREGAVRPVISPGLPVGVPCTAVWLSATLPPT
jgi:hypothetical protein